MEGVRSMRLLTGERKECSKWIVTSEADGGSGDINTTIKNLAFIHSFILDEAQSTGAKHLTVKNQLSKEVFEQEAIPLSLGILNRE